MKPGSIKVMLESLKNVKEIGKVQILTNRQGLA